MEEDPAIGMSLFQIRIMLTAFLACALLRPTPLCALQKPKAKQAAKTAAAPAANPTASSLARPGGQLKVLSSRVSQMEDGDALTSDAQLIPGETIFFSITVENYRVSATGRVELTGEMEAFDPNGVAIAPKVTENIKTALADEDKDWKPKLRAQLQIPSIARPGGYTVRYKVTDIQSSQTLEGEKKVPVTGPAVEPAETLAVRNFGFYRSEEDPQALSIPAYRPGDAVWARFVITGYRYGPENAIDVAYDVSVLNGEGKQIFSQKDAASEKSKAFYPQPWVPGGISLNLQSNMPHGAYTLVLTARDLQGNQTVAEKYPFRLE